MTKTYIERLATLFSGYQSAHGTHGEPVQEEGSLKWAIRSSAKSLRTPVTLDLWQRHVAGTYPLGVIAIREDSTCSWGSIDYDVYDANLIEIVARVARTGLPLVPCRSKSGGLHLFMFLAEPAPAGHVLTMLRNIAASIGMGGSEIFPKQATVLADRGDLGSWMVMPYFGGTFDNKIREQVGLRPAGGDMTLEEFVRSAEKNLVTAEKFAELRKIQQVSNSPNTGGPFSDGPPCLQHLARDKVQLGGQNNALMMMGIYAKKSAPGEWKEFLDKANREHLNPPGSSEGVVTAIKSLERKDYEYMCNAEPMASHCDAKTCRTRKFGVGSWGEYPQISGMSALKTDPVIWFVDVDGERLEIGTADLQNYTRFHAVCMEKLSKCYQIMKQDSWLKTVHEVMKNVVSLEPPADSKPGSTLHELMEEFLTNRSRGVRSEDLLSGRPYANEDEGRLEFRLRDLQKFLKKEGHDEMSRGKLTRAIEKMGGGTGFYNFKNKKGVNYWHVPSSQFEPTPQFDVPKATKEEVM